MYKGAIYMKKCIISVLIIIGLFMQLSFSSSAQEMILFEEYVPIIDENGVYHKWIICARQIGNQFQKYLILPANYRFSWVETDGNKRVIRRVWGATRSQNS